MKPSPSIRTTLFVFLVVLLATLVQPISGYAQNSSVTVAVEAGLDGYCKVEAWIPIQVRLENSGPSLEISVRAEVPGDGNAVWSYAQAVSLPSVARKELRMMAYPNRSVRNVDVSVWVDNDEIYREIVPLTCVQQYDALYGVVAGSASAFNVLANVDPPSGNASVAQLDIAALPDHAQGLEMLDALVFSDVDTGQLSEAQRTAIHTWVLAGGDLIVTAGPNWQKTANGLLDLLPYLPNGTTTNNEWNTLDAFTPLLTELEGDAVLATGTFAPNAIPYVSQGNTPLIVGKTFGNGQVFYFTPDLALAPLRNWDGMESVYDALLNQPTYNPSWASGITNWYSASSAVANIPGLGLPSIVLICCFLGLYVFALGPLNYVVLARLKRRELAWVTIPALVVIFSVVAIVAGSLLRGNSPVMHKTAIVQVWDDESVASVDGVVGVFSPNRRAYNLDIGSNFVAHPLPNTQFNTGSDMTLLQTDTGIRVPDLRIDVGGIEAVVVEGEIPAPNLSHNLILRRNLSIGAEIQGEVRNNTGITLQDAVFLAPDNAYLELGDIEAGQAASINLSYSGAITSTQIGYFYDQTVEQVLGPNYYSRFNDADLSRRYELLYSTFGDVSQRGSGFYLVGWGEESWFDANLGGRNFKEERTTLYIFHLTPVYADIEG